MKKIFVVGSLNMDLTIATKVLPARGMTVEGSGFLSTPGGKGANQAVASAKLGAKTYMVGAVGSAFGDELVSSLRASGADTRFIMREEGVSSGIAVIIVEQGDNRIILDKGANARVNAALVERALSEAERGDILIVQLEINADTVAYALRLAKEKGMTTVLNPAPAAEIDESAFENADYFMPNQTETQFYTGIYPDTLDSARAAADILLKKGVKNVIITLGAEGSFFASKGDEYSVKALPVKVVDTTAAGDTFVGAFAVKLSEGAGAREAMQFANAASAAAVTKRGAQISIPTRKEAEELLRNRK